MKQKIKNTTGITLVALVVTIVVLLILAGITIMYTMGENSIFKKAQEAKDKTDQAIKNEQEYFNNLDNMVNQYIGGNSSEGSTETKTEYTDSNGDKAPIPSGFYVVGDSKINPEDKNTVRDGLVISDEKDDDLDNSKHGNQFVWIPVEDYSKFHLIEGYYKGSLDTKLSEDSNPSREAGDTATAGSPGKPNNSNSVAGTAESMEMYKSVKENGGFYIARFEAGIAGTTVSTTTEDINKQTQDGTVKPVSKKGVGVWNWIPWGGTTVVEASDNLVGNDKANGAVKVARSMYPTSDTHHKVTSTLCYGVQWDATLNFIDSKYIGGTATGYVKDSTDKGNYAGNIATTGSNTAYQQKHIYDMAGNVYEWTMEAYNTDYRVVRGGDYHNDGNFNPSSYRYNYKPEGTNTYYGFRVALYL